MEIALLTLVSTLFVLPVVHFIGAILILMGSWKGADGVVARLFVGGVAVLTAVVEVSLIRGGIERLVRRWARRWSFRVAGGSGWVRMANRTPLAGWGAIRESSVSWRWIADYARGQRTHTP